jgi:hypothetical protein
MLEMITGLAIEYFKGEGGNKEGFIQSVLMESILLGAYHID